MTKAFEKKVQNYGMVDTKQYRYRYIENDNGDMVIIRLPIEYLDTTKAYEPWEVVKVY